MINVIVILCKEVWYESVNLKGYATPYIYLVIFCSICFLNLEWFEAFSTQLVDSNMPLDSSTRDRISLSSHKNRSLFCCCFDYGAREITLWIKMLCSLHVSGSQPLEVPEDTPHFRGVFPEMGRVFINFWTPTSGNVHTISTILRAKM